MDFRSRLQRPRAYNDPGHAHELTFSCFRKFRFLSKERTCEWLADAIEAAREELQFNLWAFVVMPDHVHLIVHPREYPYDTSEWIKAVKAPVGRKGVEYLRAHAPAWLPRIQVRKGTKLIYRFWQAGRGHDRNIDTARTLQYMLDYVHLNPVKAGLVQRPADWKWSSAGWYEGAPTNRLILDPIPPDWLMMSD